MASRDRLRALTHGAPHGGCEFCGYAREHPLVADGRALMSNAHAIAFKSIAPRSPMHALVVPRAHLVTWADVSAHGLATDVQTALWDLVSGVMLESGVADSCWVHQHNGAGGGQRVFHLHVHVESKRKPDPEFWQ